MTEPRDIAGRHVKPLADRLGLDLDQIRTMNVSYQAGQTVALIDWEGHARLPVEEVGRLLGSAVPFPLQPCPECIAGKHGNCDGQALDPETDLMVPCPCGAADHRPTLQGRS